MKKRAKLRLLASSADREVLAPILDELKKRGASVTETGKGSGKGETSRLKYLPPAISMNDFIFCVWAEETGFVGSAALLVLFALLLVPCCWIAFVAEDGRGRLFALGFATLVFAFLFKVMPNCRVNGRASMRAGLVTAVFFGAWMKICAVAQVGIAKTSALYGSFAFLPIVLAWLFMSWQIVLLGCCMARAWSPDGK